MRGEGGEVRFGLSPHEKLNIFSAGSEYTACGGHLICRLVKGDIELACGYYGMSRA